MWRRLLAQWGCKFRSSTPALAARSMRPSRFGAQGPDALFVGPTPFFTAACTTCQLGGAPCDPYDICIGPSVCRSGGLMSYGLNCWMRGVRLAFIPARILRGAKPADLPVVQSSKFELVINLQTARMLGLDRAALTARPCRRGDRMSAGSPCGSVRIDGLDPWLARPEGDQ